MTHLTELTKQLLDDSSLSIEDFIRQQMVKEQIEHLRDETYVWPTPEANQAAAEWLAKMNQREQELLYGDGTGVPQGVLYGRSPIEAAREGIRRLM